MAGGQIEVHHAEMKKTKRSNGEHRRSLFHIFIFTLAIRSGSAIFNVPIVFPDTPLTQFPECPSLREGVRS